MYNLFWNRIYDFLNASFAGKMFFAVVNFISSAFKASFFYKFFCEKNMSSMAENSKLIAFFRKLIFASRFTDFVSESVFVWAFSEMPKNVFASSVSLISAYVLPSAVLLFISCFGNLTNMIISALIILFGIFLLNIKAKVSDVMHASCFFRKVCDYFSIDTVTEPTKKYNKRFYLVTIGFGVLTGGSAFLFDFKLSLILWAAVLFLPMLISSPQLLIVCAFLGGTVLSSMPAFVISLFLLLVVICRLFKKIDKLPKLRVTYVLVLLYSVITLFYTLFGYAGSDGVLAGAVQFVLMSVFFSVVITVNNFQKLKKLIFSIAFCTLISSALGIYQFLTGQGGTGWTSEIYVGGLARISSTFLNPNVYGEYLILTIAIGLVALLIAKGIKERLLFAFVFIMQIINLALTYSRGCYFSVLFIIFVVIWCCDKRLLGFGVLLIPALPYVLPKNIITRIMSVGSYLQDGSVSYRFGIWQGSLAVLNDHWYEGIGIGTAAYIRFYNNYMVPGTPAQHSHNTFLQIAIELGILGLIVFIITVLFAIKDVSNVMKRSSLYAKFIAIPLIASFGGIFIQSFFDYVFYNNIIFMTFWLTLGLLIAALNIISSDKKFAVYVQKESNL